MYLLYNSVIRNKNNTNTIEGVGAIYQRIISLIALSKQTGIPFIHNKINIGHNDNNIDDNLYDELWDNFFNIKKIELTEEEKQEYTPVYIDILTPYQLQFLINNKNKKYLIYIKIPYIITYNNPNDYYSLIQNDIIQSYDEVNSNRYLIYNTDPFKNKINIAIHIRVYNDMDPCGDNIDYLNNYIKCESTRFNLNCDFYIELIKKLKYKYQNSAIHIFSQEKYFDIRFKELRSIDNINLHLNMDNFETLHHLCKADVLVLGLSSFSHLAGYYNKNEVIYTHYEYHQKAFDKWIDVDEIMNIKILKE